MPGGSETTMTSSGACDACSIAATQRDSVAGESVAGTMAARVGMAAW
jgi:hypothetical protein